MNNREIKFRVYNTSCKYFVESLSPTSERLKSTMDILSLSQYLIRNHFDNVDNIIFQQYTGLKDKNGKEIYEGDIVKTSLAHMFRSNVYEVKYHQNRFTPDDICDTTDVEVIGNIFENLNLLNTPIAKIVPHEDDMENNITDLHTCDQCGESAWDGYICHSCGVKNI